jgi:hypothetical protein
MGHFHFGCMKASAWIATFALLSGIARAEDPLKKPILSEERGTPMPTATPRPTAAKILDVVLVSATTNEPTNQFTSDTPKLRAVWKGKRLQAGDQVDAIWLAEDVGKAAPKHSRITRFTVTAYKPDDDGAFVLERPRGGWPPGKYRLEAYLNGILMQRLDFSIEKGATIELGHN